MLRCRLVFGNRTRANLRGERDGSAQGGGCSSRRRALLATRLGHGGRVHQPAPGALSALQYHVVTGKRALANAERDYRAWVKRAGLRLDGERLPNLAKDRQHKLFLAVERRLANTSWLHLLRSWLLNQYPEWGHHVPMSQPDGISLGRNITLRHPVSAAAGGAYCYRALPHADYPSPRPQY